MINSRIHSKVYPCTKCQESSSASCNECDSTGRIVIKKKEEVYIHCDKNSRVSLLAKLFNILPPPIPKLRKVRIVGFTSRQQENEILVRVGYRGKQSFVNYSEITLIKQHNDTNN